MRSGSCEPEVRPCREGEGGSAGIPPCFLFLFFCFSIFFFLQRDGCSTGFPPSKFSFFLSFLKLVFFWRRRQRSSRIWFPKSFELSCFFSPAYFYIFGEKGDLERIPSFLSRTILPFLHNLLFHLRFALWTYILWPIAFPVWRCKKKLHAKKDKVYLLIVCGSFALTKSPCNPPFEFWKSSSTWPEEWGPPLCNHCIAVHRSKKLCIIIKVLHFNWS